MAINTSNSNYVNISNLPRAQEALPTDLLILQTENGTQTITFNDFNAVKTDAAGNATVIGQLTGNIAFFDSVSASGNVSSLNYFSNNIKGTFAATNYYNSFTVNGGLVTSAAYRLGSPEYNNITQTILPTTTAWQNTIYKRVIEYADTADILANSSTRNITIYNFLSGTDLTASQIKPYHFNLTVNTRVSSFPWISNILASPTSKDLSFVLNMGYTVPSTVNVGFRFLYAY